MTIFESLRLMKQLEDAKKKGNAHLLSFLFSENERNLLGEGNRSKKSNSPNVSQGKDKNQGQQIQNNQKAKQQGVFYVKMKDNNVPAFLYLKEEKYAKQALNPYTQKMSGTNEVEEWESMLIGEGFIDTPIGQVKVEISELRRHIMRGKSPEEQQRRFTSAGYVLMTLQSPHEIWVNGEKALSYVFIREFEAPESQSGRYVQIVTVKCNTYIRTHYGTSDDPHSLYKHRWGYLIYKKGWGNGGVPMKTQVSSTRY